MHLPKADVHAATKEESVAATAVAAAAAAAAAARRRALYRMENARTGFRPRRTGGQIFPAPLTALIAPGSRPTSSTTLRSNPDRLDSERVIRR